LRDLLEPYTDSYLDYSWVRRRILRLNLISIAVNCNAKVHREENVSSYTQDVWWERVEYVYGLW
jgi:hypothetical protein